MGFALELGQAAVIGRPVLWRGWSACHLLLFPSVRRERPAHTHNTLLTPLEPPPLVPSDSENILIPTLLGLPAHRDEPPHPLPRAVLVRRELVDFSGEPRRAVQPAVGEEAELIGVERSGADCLREGASVSERRREGGGLEEAGWDCGLDQSRSGDLPLPASVPRLPTSYPTHPVVPVRCLVSMNV